MVKLLFSGYAPVHFVCFRPLYERLRQVRGLDVWFSGGKKVGRNGTLRYDAAALYRPFDIPRDHVLPVDVMRRRTFDLAFSAHTSGFFPNRPCPKVQIFHGVSFRNAAVREDQRKYDALFAVGPYMMRVLKRRRIAPRRAVPVGFPKLDPLRNGSLRRDEILDSLGLRGDRPVILYAPTGQKNNSLETMGEEVIERIRASGRFELLIKPHDHPRNPINWFRRLHRFEGPHVKLVRGLDVVPFLYAADLLISDASSVASEFTLLDRPIVFLDVPKLIAHARRKEGALDLKTYGRKTGITVRRPQDAVPTIGWFLDHPRHRSSTRRRMAKDLFYNPGRATDVAVDWLMRRLRREFPWLGA